MKALNRKYESNIEISHTVLKNLCLASKDNNTISPVKSFQILFDHSD